jgi:Domain of unknown function (DUF932)
MSADADTGPPWGNLGFNFRGENVREEIKVSPLGWRVVKSPLICEDGDKVIKIPNKVALIRDTDPPIMLSMVSSDWNPIQNDDAISMFQEFAKTIDTHLEIVGSLRDGKIIWALAPIGTPIEVVDGDVVRPYLLFSNPQEYGKSTDVRLMYLRREGMSTYVVTGENRVPHRGPPDIVDDVLAWARAQVEEMQVVSRRMARTPMDDRESMTYLASIFSGKIPLIRRDLAKPARMAYDAMGKLARFAPGTVWHAFSAACHVMDHSLGFGRDTRVSSSWYGLNQTRKRRAMVMAQQRI